MLRLLDASVFLETLRAASLAQCGCRLPRHDDVGSLLTSWLLPQEHSGAGKFRMLPSALGPLGGRQNSVDGTLQGEMTDQELLLLLDIKSRRDDGTLSWRREIFKAATLHPKSKSLTQVPWRLRDSLKAQKLSALLLMHVPSEKFAAQMNRVSLITLGFRSQCN